MPLQIPHRRQNALTGEWVLVSPQRNRRPWHGKTETPLENLKRHDPACHLCPGNLRASGEINPQYDGVFVFDNDFPALSHNMPAGVIPELSALEAEFCKTQQVRGICRVICFSPRHDLTLSQLSAAEVRNVVAQWRQQFMELIRQHRWVQIFENKGEMMGCSNPHPHGQIWAGDFLPNDIRREDERQRAYFTSHGAPLLADYLRFEECARERIVEENEDWVVLTPYWAVWPFETMLLPKGEVRDFADVDDDRLESLAALLKSLLMRYDRLFDCPMPYCLGWHCAPAQAAGRDVWRLHAHCYPPLLRSATVRKFMVGFEMLCEPQRDMLPEDAAARLREI